MGEAICLFTCESERFSRASFSYVRVATNWLVCDTVLSVTGQVLRNTIPQLIAVHESDTARLISG